MKLSRLLIPFFVSSSTLVTGFSVYLLATKTFPKSDIFFQTCSAIIKDLYSHLHTTPQGIASILIIFVALTSISLVSLQIAAYFFTQNNITNNVVKNGLPYKLRYILSKNKVLNNSVVLVKSNKLSAFTTGIKRPQIVVTSSLCEKLSMKQLEAVLFHEMYHLQRRHPFWSFILSLISRALFFVPLIDYLARQIKMEFELLADTNAIELQGTSNYLHHALVLNIESVGNASNFAAHSVEKRIDSLVTQQLTIEKIRIKQLLLSTLSLVIMFGLAVLKPNILLAETASNSETSCQFEAECINTDCSDFSLHHENDNFTPLIPASFSF